jgi:CheY-like chemotaxis protein
MTPTPTSPANPAVILIADDNPEALRMLDMRIKREGHQTILVENGRQALDVLATEPVDVLLLDIEMPEVDGYGVLAAVKADPRLAELPVLIISGGGDQDDLVRCIEMGAVDFLPKPFNQAVLRARIGVCIAQKRQRDQERQLLETMSDRTGTPQVVPAETAEWRAGSTSGPESSLATVGPVNPPVPLPERLGRIVIQRLLGYGGMGQVYLGHHELLDLPVAVKLLRPDLTGTPGARERLLREARLAARLAHRHIVRLLEVSEVEQGVYLAFEYVSGGTLKDLLARQPSRQLPLATAIRLTQEAALALGEANRLGITHRDIKPANLLLTPEGELKVADFGLAKQARAAAAAAPQLTMEGALLGTPLYMAPEQLTLGSVLDIRTDLYALGCVLYEMLVGHAPFAPPGLTTAPPGTGDDIFYHQTHTAPQRPPSFRADIPEWLESICLKLLAKRPEDRFATPDDLLEVLRTGPPLPS